jgi:hypothetical protein
MPTFAPSSLIAGGRGKTCLLLRTRDNGHPGMIPRVAVIDGTVGLQSAPPRLDTPEHPGLSSEVIGPVL